MGKKFKNGDVVKVIENNESLKFVHDYVLPGSIGIVINDDDQEHILIDFNSYKFYVSARELRLVLRKIK